jgi:hypothetical protein
VLTLVDLLLAGVRWCVDQVLGGKDAVLRLWDGAGGGQLAFEILNSLLGRLRELERYLDRLRTRMRYREFFEQLTAPMSERYRSLRKRQVRTQ